VVPVSGERFAGEEEEGGKRSREARKEGRPPKAPPQLVHGPCSPKALVEEAKARRASDRDHRPRWPGAPVSNKLPDELPEQYYDVGIAEQGTAVLFRVGPSSDPGAKQPVCAHLLDLPPGGRSIQLVLTTVCLQES